MKKNIFSLTDLFSVLTVCGLWLFYREEITVKTDEVFRALLGKNLTGRNLMFQVLVFGTIFAITVLLPIIFRLSIKKRPFLRHAADVLILLILAIPAVQLLIICANQVLRRDDYWEIADARTYGFPGSMFYEMKRFNGRYTGWGLRSLHAILPDIPYIDIFLFINLILLTAGTSMIMHRLLKSQQPPAPDRIWISLQSVLSGFGLSIAFILMASNIWEFWFWGSGTMIYGFGLSMCILSIALILRLTEDRPQRVSDMILPALTCFLTCGCSELCTASLAAFILIALIRNRIRAGTWNRRVLFLFAEVCLLTAVVLFSSSLNYAGEFIRPEGENTGSPIGTLMQRLPDIIGWAFHGLHGYTFIKYKELLLFLGIAFLFGSQLHFEREKIKLYLILSLLLTVTAHLVLMINTALDYMPPRVITIGICWFFSAMALVCMLLGSVLFCKDKESKTDRIRLLLCAILVCLAMNQFYSGNIDEARKIRSSWFVRDALLKQRENTNESVETCSLPSPGSFREDILEDPEDVFNKATAAFYKIPKIFARFRCYPYGELFLPADLYNN